MTTYGVEYLNGLVIAVYATSQDHARQQAEEKAIAHNWPSKMVRRTWLYNGRNKRYRARSELSKVDDYSGFLFAR